MHCSQSFLHFVHLQLTTNTKQSGIALIRLARLARKVTAKMAQDLSEIHEYLFVMPVRRCQLTHLDMSLWTLCF